MALTMAAAIKCWIKEIFWPSGLANGICSCNENMAQPSGLSHCNTKEKQNQLLYDTSI